MLTPIDVKFPTFDELNFNYVAIVLVVCQFSRDVIGYEDS